MIYTTCMWLLISLLVKESLCFTQPSEIDRLSLIRDKLLNKSLNWNKALSTWNCPTDPLTSDASCDPCSIDWSGNWEHLHCRGSSGRYGEGSDGKFDGYVSTVHVTDQNLDGPVAKEWCLLTRLREFDLDGGHQCGPFPEWVKEPSCLTLIQELDFSYNRLTGSIPSWIDSKATLQEFKVEHNHLSGAIPSALGSLPELWRLRLAYNHLTGTIPASFVNLSASINQLDISHNNLSGNLDSLGTSKLMVARIHSNQGLCGMVPASVRWASGFNPSGTRLGYPC